MSGVISLFEGLTDPRVERTKYHSLKDILGPTICVVLGGCNDWAGIEYMASVKNCGLNPFWHCLMASLPTIQSTGYFQH